MPDTPRHILAAACLVRRDDGTIAMVRTPRRGWECPGGQIEQGEDVLTGLKREVLEETGLTVEIDRLVGVYSNVAESSKLMLDFLGWHCGGDLTPSQETPEAAWMTPDEALRVIEHPAVRQRVHQMVSFTGQIIYRAYTVRPYQVQREHKI